MLCEHTDTSYDQMYWFRQLPGQNMELIVISYAYSPPDYGHSNKSKYEAIKSEAKTGTLTVKVLEPEDSGVYFCAAY